MKVTNKPASPKENSGGISSANPGKLMSQLRENPVHIDTTKDQAHKTGPTPPLSPLPLSNGLKTINLFIGGRH